MQTVSKQEMAEVDELVPEKYGITISRMMENAGYQIAEFIRRKFSREDKIVVYCGKGNNGGDGLVAARRLHNWNFDVKVVLASEELDGIRKEELEILRNIGVGFVESAEADVALDALIGYNLKGEPRPPFDSLIEEVNGAENVVSVDMPSGVDANTGERLGTSVKPNYTVTLALPKDGLENVPGEIWVADISIPSEVYERFGLEVDLFEKESLVKVW